MADFVTTVLKEPSQKDKNSEVKVECEFCHKYYGVHYLRRHKQREHRDERKDPKHIWRCPGCTHVFNGTAKQRHLKICIHAPSQKVKQEDPPSSSSSSEPEENFPVLEKKDEPKTAAKEDSKPEKTKQILPPSSNPYRFLPKASKKMTFKDRGGALKEEMTDEKLKKFVQIFEEDESEEVKPKGGAVKESRPEKTTPKKK